MKAISLWQPHAQLIAIGEKHYETRTWTTKYRGPIAIHAGKNKDALKSMALDLAAGRVPADSFIAVLGEVIRRHGLTVNDFPTGAIVAVGELTAIYDAGLLYPKLTGAVRHFGDFSAGRYAWRIENVKLIAPIPMRGQQGLWNLDGWRDS